jgi:tellurite resistance protein TehA-like permease
MIPLTLSSTRCALVIWGLGLFWLCNAVLTILHLASKRTIPFGMGWWSFTFPIGVFATATTQFGTELGSGAFNIIGTFISLCVVALWLLCMAFTLKEGWKGPL